MSVKQFLLFVIMFWHGASALWAGEVLRSLAEIRALTDDAASRGQPVSVDAVVIYANSSLDELIVYDGTASCYTGVALSHVASEQRPKVGDRVTLAGYTQANGFFPHFQTQTWKITGRGEIPAPHAISADEIYLPRFDSAWVEVPAVVTGVETGGIAYTLVVEVFGQTFKADVPHCADSASRAELLMQRPVRLRAILGSVFNPHKQLTSRHFLVPSFDDIVPIAPVADATKASLIKVIDLLKANSSMEDLVRLEGVVTSVDRNGFCLRDTSASAFVQAVMTRDLVPGDRVTVEGYGAIAPFRPMLRATRVHLVASGPPPNPVSIGFPANDAALLQMELVRLVADVLGVQVMKDETIYQCQTDGVVFEAILPYRSTPEIRIAQGDRVTLTGICELTTTHPIPRIEWVNGVRLRLANAESVQLIRKGPWLTQAKLYAAFSMMTVAALLGIFGTIFFRRVVAKQARIIGEKIGTEAVSDERDRMARELHDTLEQQLVGVALQLDGLDKVAKIDPSQISSRLGLARRMLRHTRVEARRSVWDLRSKLLELQGLGTALSSMVTGATSDQGPKVVLQIDELTRPLPAGSDFHLLRIAQEGLANAIKHANAREILISLQGKDDSVVLTIQDDGCGFGNTAADEQTVSHFGILGMRERCEKIAASFEIESSPGHGCLIRVTLSNQPDQ